MVELRKRKAPTQPPVAEKKKKPATTASKPAKETSQPEKPSAPDTIPKVGDTISLDDFGGEIETNDGAKTTLKKLVDESKAGVVLFTYPKASTPGCKSSPNRALSTLAGTCFCRSGSCAPRYEASLHVPGWSRPSDIHWIVDLQVVNVRL